MFRNQQEQHAKEAAFIARLKDYCNKNGIPFKDTTGTKEDTSYGIDCWIDGKPFDLKCSFTTWLTVFKELPNGQIYRPYNRHTRIPYLYCLQSSGKCYIITKQEFAKTIGSINPDDLDAYLHICLGDGNVNHSFDIKRFLTEDNLFIDINKEK